MTTPCGDTPREDSATGADDQHPNGMTPEPEWVPVEPLLSSEMFLAVFAGLRPVTAASILAPAFELVACHRRFRLAFGVLASPFTTAAQIKEAAAELVSAQDDIEFLVCLIDEAVAQRLKRRQKEQLAVQADRVPAVAIHTQSIGEIAARMAELWESVLVQATDRDDDLPAAEQLVQLCTGYDCLAAEIESGRRLPPGL
jgi:hypothetical protein